MFQTISEDKDVSDTDNAHTKPSFTLSPEEREAAEKKIQEEDEYDRLNFHRGAPPKRYPSTYDQVPIKPQAQPTDAQAPPIAPQAQPTTSQAPPTTTSQPDELEVEEKKKKKKKKKGKKKRLLSSDEESEEESPQQRRRRTGLGLPPPVGGTSTDAALLQQYTSQGAVPSADVAKMKAMEDKLAQLEEKTSSSLYNIEALLRNAVFHRGMSGRAGPAAFMQGRERDRRF